MSIVAIVALVVVLLIVALILIILLTPITYSIEWNGRTPYSAELKVQWLWRVLKLHLAYLEGKPFYKQLYLLGMRKWGNVNDYEQWLEQRVDDEYQKAMEEIENDPMTAQAEAIMRAMNGTGQPGTGPTAGRTSGQVAANAGESTDAVRSAGRTNSGSTTSSADTESATTSTASGDTSSSTAASDSTSSTVRVETAQTEPEGPEARAAKYDSMQENPTLKPDDEVLSSVTFNSDGSVKERIFTKIETVKETVKERFQEPDPNDPVASFKSQIPTFWFMKHVTNTELWRQLFLVSKRCYDHSKPRDIFVEGIIGLGDPYKGGMLASMLYSIWPNEAEHIEIDYLNFHIEGSGHIKGRIVIGALAWHGTRFVLSKPVRQLAREGIHVFLTKRKEAKQLEKLKAEQAASV